MLELASLTPGREGSTARAARWEPQDARRGPICLTRLAPGRSGRPDAREGHSGGPASPAGVSGRGADPGGPARRRAGAMLRDGLET